MISTQILGALTRRSVRFATPMARAYVESNMTYSVRITRPKSNEFDRRTGGFTNPADDRLVADGVPAHISLVDGGATYNISDEPVYFASTSATIPLSTEQPFINDEIEVLDGPDPTTVGRRFRINGVTTAGIIPTGYKLSLTGIQLAPNAIQ